MNQTQLKKVMSLVFTWIQDTKYTSAAKFMTHLSWMNILMRIHGWERRHLSPNYQRAPDGSLRLGFWRVSLSGFYMLTSRDSGTAKSSMVSLPFRPFLEEL